VPVPEPEEFGAMGLLITKEQIHLE